MLMLPEPALSGAFPHCIKPSVKVAIHNSACIYNAQLNSVCKFGFEEGEWNKATTSSKQMVN